MGLDAQEQLAKGYKARDVQDGGRCEVVKLEFIELQEPPEKRMNWKSEPSYQIRDEAYPLSFGMVLYGRRPTAGPSSDRPPGVQQRSSEETPELAPTEPSTGEW